MQHKTAAWLWRFVMLPLIGASPAVFPIRVFGIAERGHANLAPPNSDFHFVDTDHLGLGANKGGVGAIARALLDGKTLTNKGAE
jgi:hypothetical protein